MPSVQLPVMGLSPAQWRATKLPEKALLIAAHLCDVEHVHEEPRGSNRGSMIDEFLRAARTDLGKPWCAALCCYCVKLAGRDVFSEHYGRGVRYPASVVSWAEWARASGRWSRTPRRGRLFVIAKPGLTHMGFVANDLGGSAFATIEGNSNDEGSREGYEMCRRQRTVAAVSGFVDLGGLE